MTTTPESESCRLTLPSNLDPTQLQPNGQTLEVA